MKKLTVGILAVGLLISGGFNVYQAQINATLTEDVDVAYDIADDMASEVDACYAKEDR